jgi:hypothetical protein
MALTKVKGAVLEPLTVNGNVVSGGADLDGAVTINESGADVDFRVESSTTQHALFVQGSDGAVGIGQSAPNAPLVVGSVLGAVTSQGRAASFYSGNDTSVDIISDANVAGAGPRLRLLENNPTKFGAELFVDSGTQEFRIGRYANDVENTALSFHFGEIVANEDGDDKDFRVESDTNTHALFVQGSDGFVGVNASTPLAALLIESNTPAGLTIASPNTTANAICFADGDSSVAGIIEYSHPTDTMTLFTNTVSRLELNATEAAFNEGGNDVDFRVESDTNDHALFVRGSDGKVSIGGITTLALGDQKTNEVVIDDATAYSTAITGGSGYIPQASDTLALINKSSTGNYTSLHFRSVGPSGNAAGKIALVNQTAGQSKFAFMLRDLSGADINEKMVIDNLGVTVNPGGTDRDFRVESDTNTHALFVQGSDGAVGINTSSPAAELHITDNSGAAAGAALIKLSLNAASTDGYSGLLLTSRNGGTDYSPSIVTNYLGGITYESPSRHYFKCNAVEALSAGPSSVVINEPGNDVDFRVESDTNTHALFVQGSDGYVGINESSPSGVLHINNPSTPGSATGYPVNGDELILEGANNVGMTIIGGDAAGARIYMGGNTDTDAVQIAWIGGSTNELQIRADTATDFNTQMTFKQGVQVGAPTGGYKGTGTINATAVYDDNTLLTDFVLDQAVDGEIDFAFYDSLELGGKAAREWDARNLDIDHYEAQWRERKALPSFRSKAERFDNEGKEIRDSVGTLIQGLQQELETAMVHIAQLNARIKHLEEK